MVHSSFKFMTAKQIHRALNWATVAGTIGTVALLALKECRVINWSMWVMLAPVMLPVVVIIGAIFWAQYYFNK